MRIGFDARVLYKKKLKGIGRYLQYLVIYFLRLEGNHEFFLFYNPKDAEIIPEFENKRVIHIPVEGPNEELWEQWFLPKAIRKNNIDAFHSTTNTTMLFPPCPTVISIHDVMSHLQAPRWGRRANFYWNFVQRIAYQKSSFFITCSNFSKEKINNHLNLPLEKIHVISYGIDEKYRRISSEVAADRLKHFSLKRPYLLMIGGKLLRKNILTALKAFELVASQKPDLILVITGMKGFEPIEKEVAKSVHAERIKLLDYVSEDELVALYNNAALFIFPSLDEGYGFPPLEAMACGAAVIASNASCIPEIVGDAAFLADCRTPETMKEAILQVIENPKLKSELIEKGLRHIRNFDWAKTACETFQIYEKVASEYSLS